MNSDQEDGEIKIQREPGAFFVIINGNESHLEYKLINGVMDIIDVFVHESQRGMGLAAKLCVEAFRFSREREWKIHPTCPYVKDKFIPEHPEFNDMIDESVPFYGAKKK